MQTSSSTFFDTSEINQKKSQNFKNYKNEHFKTYILALGEPFKSFTSQVTPFGPILRLIFKEIRSKIVEKTFNLCIKSMNVPTMNVTVWSAISEI